MANNERAFVAYSSEKWLGASENSQTYYESEQWVQSLGLLQYLCQYTQHILIVTGVPGVGKSTLKQAFLDKAQHQFKLCTLLAEKNWDVALLMRRLAMGFGLEWDQDAASKGTRYHNRPVESPTWVVIIDDAHHLPSRVLQALLQLGHPFASNENQLHFILIGDETLETRLSDPHLKIHAHQAIQTLELRALDGPDTEAYARFKGFHQDEHPNLDLKALYAKSSGIPAKIDLLLKGSLMDEITTDEKVTPTKVSPLVKLKTALKSIPTLYFTALGATVGASLITASLLSFFIHPVSAPVTPLSVPSLPVEGEKVSTPKPEIPKTLASPSAAETKALVVPKVESTTSVGKPASSNDVALTPKTSPTPVVPSPKSSAVAETSGAAATPPAPIKAPEPASPPKVEAPKTKAVDTAAPKAEQPSNDAKRASVTASKLKENGDNRQPGEPLIIIPGPLVETQVEIIDAKSVKRLTAKAQANAQTRSEPLKTQSQKTKLTDMERGLLKIPADHYALQLMGTHSDAAAKQFIQTLDNKHQARYYQTQYKGQAWYVVVAGDFSNREAAVQAIYKLPLKLQQSQPWVHRYAEIHRALKRTGPST